MSGCGCKACQTQAVSYPDVWSFAGGRGPSGPSLRDWLIMAWVAFLVAGFLAVVGLRVYAVGMVFEAIFDIIIVADQISHKMPGKVAP